MSWSLAQVRQTWPQRLPRRGLDVALVESGAILEDTF